VAGIRFVPPEDAPFRNLASILGDLSADEERLAKYTPAQLKSETRFCLPGGLNELQLFEVRLPPDTDVGAHAHVADEVMYVLEGELRFGRKVLPAGSAVSIPGCTVYAFRAGPQGARFLNFRPSADSSYLTKEEALALRRDDEPGD
jgi:quercetin dioxygenase-like cupin family protein